MSLETTIKFIIGLAITYLMASNYHPENHSALLGIASPLATVAAMLFGFVIASVTFLSSIKNNTLITSLKNTQMFPQLLSQLQITGTGLISSCIFMVLSIFSPSKSIMKNMGYNWDYSLLIIGFFLLIISMFEFFSCWKRVNMIVKKL